MYVQGYTNNKMGCTVLYPPKFRDQWQQKAVKWEFMTQILNFNHFWLLLHPISLSTQTHTYRDRHTHTYTETDTHTHTHTETHTHTHYTETEKVDFFSSFYSSPLKIYMYWSHDMTNDWWKCDGMAWQTIGEILMTWQPIGERHDTISDTLNNLEKRLLVNRNGRWIINEQTKQWRRSEWGLEVQQNNKKTLKLCQENKK